MPEPTTSTLIFLFADKLVNPDKFSTQGVKVPCTENKVRKKELAETLMAAERGRIAGFFMGKTNLEPNCSKIPEANQGFEKVAQAWELFRQSEKSLADRLVKECAKAIESREQRDED